MKLIALAFSVMVAAVCANTASAQPEPAPAPDPTIATAMPTKVTIPQMLAMPVSPDGQEEGTPPTAISTGSVCYAFGWDHNNNALSFQFGGWPWDMRVIEWRKTCFDVGSRLITYRYSEVHLSTTLCSSHDRWKRKVAGGVGFYSVTVETGAFFDCQSPYPWVAKHKEIWQQWTCYASELSPCSGRAWSY